MPAPDVSRYLDLSIYDVTAQGLVDLAVDDAATKLPEWTPAEGHVEMVLLEAAALLIEQAVFALNRLPGTVVEVLMRLHGEERDPGAPGTGTVQVTFSDLYGHVLPAGSHMQLHIVGLPDPVPVVTVDDLTVPDGLASGTVTVATEGNTPDANGAPVGSNVELVDSYSMVETVTLTTTIVDGRAVEDAQQYLDRAAAFFGSRSGTLVRASDFALAALSLPGVARAVGLDDFDPTAGSGGPGSHPGHIAVAVVGDGGVDLTAAAKIVLEADLDRRASAQLVVHVVDPTITVVPVTAVVVVDVGRDPAAVQAAAEAAVAGYLSSAIWPWAGTVRRNSLIGVLSAVDGVAYVLSLTVPANDVTLSGAAPLADAGLLLITVQ